MKKREKKNAWAKARQPHEAVLEVSKILHQENRQKTWNRTKGNIQNKGEMSVTVN